MTELSRVGLFASLPGETLGKLAEKMRRDEIQAGTVLINEGEPGDRFFVLLSGVAGVSQSELGGRRILKAGEFFGEVALAMGVPRTATVTAMTPCVVASCDQTTFDELLRPLFADEPQRAPSSPATGVREPRPYLLRPVAECRCRERRPTRRRDEIDPEERAAPAEVTERARGDHLPPSTGPQD